MAKSAVTFPPRQRPGWHNIRSWLRWHLFCSRQVALEDAERQAIALSNYLDHRCDQLLACVELIAQVIEAAEPGSIISTWAAITEAKPAPAAKRHLSVAR